ncbi:gluconokinase [Eudoraea chungangensis]|uniref:gluconokinase n=1 Tax=Eudoraea chungangensis TaxID=1481905 RepID=UPI0023ECEFE4|nr:gluconokinase [Eudoraea chungangensis]
MKIVGNIVYIIGVSGCGKSTVGSMLADKLQLPFFDADDFHPKENVKKMASGVPLTDADRIGWLEKLNALAIDHKENGAIIGCSALKKTYRNLLEQNIEDITKWVFLDGSFDEIWLRMKKRKDHFMPSTLLESQFKTLEPPVNALNISISQTPEEMVAKILLELKA